MVPLFITPFVSCSFAQNDDDYDDDGTLAC